MFKLKLMVQTMLGNPLVFKVLNTMKLIPKTLKENSNPQLSQRMVSECHQQGVRQIIFITNQTSIESQSSKATRQVGLGIPFSAPHQRTTSLCCRRFLTYGRNWFYFQILYFSNFVFRSSCKLLILDELWSPSFME